MNKKGSLADRITEYYYSVEGNDDDCILVLADEVRALEQRCAELESVEARYGKGWIKGVANALKTGGKG